MVPSRTYKKIWCFLFVHFNATTYLQRGSKGNQKRGGAGGPSFLMAGGGGGGGGQWSTLIF